MSNNSSSERSSSPSHDEDVVAETAAAQTPATATPTARKKQAVKGKGVSLLDVIVEVLVAMLGGVLDPKLVKTMAAKAANDPHVLAAVEQFEAQGADGRGKGPAKVKVKGEMRSAYNMFVTSMFAALKAAGVALPPLGLVSSVWQGMPEDLKKDVTSRLNALKGPYNKKVQDGESPDLAQMLAAHAAEAGLQPIDFIDIHNTYGGPPSAAAADGAADNGKPKGKKAVDTAAAVAKPAAAAAATPAAAAAEGGKRAAEPSTEGKSAKKSKKEKEKKKHKAQAEGAATAEKRKKEKRKHKHEKVREDQE